MPEWFILVLFTLIVIEQQGINSYPQFNRYSDINNSPCILPEYPPNGYWRVFGNKTVQPGDEVSHKTIIYILCNANYRPAGPRNHRCDNGIWDNNITDCAQFCPPLGPLKKYQFTCSHNGEESDCSNSRDGTVAQLTCAEYYEESKKKDVPLSVCKDGSWKIHTPDCVPKCGNQAKFLKDKGDGSQVWQNAYPWHVGLYRNNSQKDYICGGTLINEKAIITAAHCVTGYDGKLESAEEFIVAVGKYYSNLNDKRDQFVQYSAIKDMAIPDAYSGQITHFLGDIAVLIVETAFKLTERVQPVCVDWHSQHEDDLNSSEDKAIIPGWGMVNTTINKPSEVLKETKIPIVSNQQCEQDMPEFYKRSFTSDKLCAGYINKSIGICLGDSGGGLVKKSTKNNKYYINGVASTGQKNGNDCRMHLYATYTKISNYTSFISNNLPKKEEPVLTTINTNSQTNQNLDYQDNIIFGFEDKSTHPPLISINLPTDEPVLTTSTSNTATSQNLDYSDRIIFGFDD